MSASANSPEARRGRRQHAARVVAANALDAEDLTQLLNMLGLTAAEGRHPPAPAGRPVPAPRRPSEADRDLAANLLAAVTHALL